MFHNRHILTGVVIILHAATASATGGDEPLLATTLITGSTAYSAGDLFNTYGEQLGKPITRERSEAISRAVISRYEQDGFSRPRATIDAQLASRGILRIDVVEPRISQVNITGGVGPYHETLEIIAKPLRGSRPIRPAELQRAVQKMRELPGLSVKVGTAVEPSEPDAYRLDVEASYRPMEGQARFTNRGTDEVGPTFLMGQVIANSPFGRGERIGLLVAMAQDFEEYRGSGLLVDLPFNDGRTRGHLSMFRSNADPTERVENRNDHYGRERLLVRGTQQMVLTTTYSVFLGAALDIEDQRIDRNETRWREDRLRALELNGRISWRMGDGAQYLATLDLRKGLNALGADLFAPDLVGDARVLDYSLVRAQLVRAMQIMPRWSLRIDLLGQTTSDHLPYSERFKIGGERVGRGFEVTELAGDHGIAGKLELRRELTNADTPLVGRTSVYAFYDAGAVWSNATASSRDSATSTGVGVGATGARFGGYLELAKPLTRPDVEGRSGFTTFAELSYRF